MNVTLDPGKAYRNKATYETVTVFPDGKIECNLSVIETTRCKTCGVYHQLGGPHECARQIEAPKA